MRCMLGSCTDSSHVGQVPGAWLFLVCALMDNCVYHLEAQFCQVGRGCLAANAGAMVGTLSNNACYDATCKHTLTMSVSPKCCTHSMQGAIICI